MIKDKNKDELVKALERARYKIQEANNITSSLLNIYGFHKCKVLKKVDYELLYGQQRLFWLIKLIRGEK